jgi:transcriptional regulator with XRE-family HTH domain
MAVVSRQFSIGPVLREWRERRRLTQMELALGAGISTRHLSFVETGRSQPGREIALRILKQLDVPFREQNRLLLASGHAPAFPERSLDDPELSPVREALDQILSSHEPFPAVVVDRHWNLIAANSPMLALAERVAIDPALLEPPINILRLGFHPRGLSPVILNLGHWRAHFCQRLERQIAVTGDPDLTALLDEIVGYPIPDDDQDPGPDPEARAMLGPVRFRPPDGGELSFFGMFATFDTPFEVTTSELAMELLFPADQATAEALAGPATREACGESA